MYVIVHLNSSLANGFRLFACACVCDCLCGRLPNVTNGYLIYIQGAPMLPLRKGYTQRRSAFIMLHIGRRMDKKGAQVTCPRRTKSRRDAIRTRIHITSHIDVHRYIHTYVDTTSHLYIRRHTLLQQEQQMLDSAGTVDIILSVVSISCCILCLCRWPFSCVGYGSDGRRRKRRSLVGCEYCVVYVGACVCLDVGFDVCMNVCMYVCIMVTSSVCMCACVLES